MFIKCRDYLAGISCRLLSKWSHTSRENSVDLITGGPMLLWANVVIYASSSDDSADYVRYCRLAR